MTFQYDWNHWMFDLPKTGLKGKRSIGKNYFALNVFVRSESSLYGPFIKANR